MPVQDDERERQLIELFLLTPGGEGRIGTDAFLEIPGQTSVPFELKSTTTGSVSTVRDFGPHYLEKWKNRHWLIGVYEKTGQDLLYCLHGTPRKMLPWIIEKSEYVEPDFMLAKFAGDGLTVDALERIVGLKSVYSIEDAQRIQKKQYSNQEYRDLMDRPSGYSKERMLEILRARLSYIVARGSTLNNPHIPSSYFHGWPRITERHAEELRASVAADLESI